MQGDELINQSQMGKILNNSDFPSGACWYNPGGGKRKRERDRDRIDSPRPT